MYKHKTLIIIVAAFCSLFPPLLLAQVDTVWVRRYNGPGNYADEAYAISIDDSGNVYVTGRSYWSSNYHAYATVKYNSAGIQQWVARYVGFGNNWDAAKAIAVDNSGNVYVTGFSGSGTSYDYATIKYNSLGDTVWVRRYNGPGNDVDSASSIAVDDAGNVYVTGTSYGSSTGRDCATIKYNSVGDTVWVRRYNGPGNNDDGGNALAIDASGNVYITGWSYQYGDDYVTIKYNSSGDTVWTRKYNGPTSFADVALAIKVDLSGSVYITGLSQGVGSTYPEDYATIKYNSDGDTVWVRRYNGPGDYVDAATAIAVDDSGSVYVTGRSYASGTNYDYATIKYNSAGAQQWLQRYSGPGNNYDRATAIVLDNSRNVYVTGWSRTGSSGTEDYATVKYNSNGVQEWVHRYNGPDNSVDFAHAMVVDGAGNVYVTGCSNTSISLDYLTIKYVQANAIEENQKLLAFNCNPIEIYPNPAKTYFTIRLPEMLNQVQHDKMTIKIYDVTGNAVKELKSFGVRELRVPLDGIKSGVYFVKVNEKVDLKKAIITN